MPGGDRTGPAGMGPMTGRAAGFCTGNNVPGFANPVAGRGFGFGRGFGMGRGMGFGFRGGRGGWGRGYGRAAYGPYPYDAAVAYNTPYAVQPTPDQEADMLKEQANYFEDALEGIKKRIAELKSAVAK